MGKEMSISNLEYAFVDESEAKRFYEGIFTQLSIYECPVCKRSNTKVTRQGKIGILKDDSANAHFPTLATCNECQKYLVVASTLQERE